MAPVWFRIQWLSKIFALFFSTLVIQNFLTQHTLVNISFYLLQPHNPGQQLSTETLLKL